MRLGAIIPQGTDSLNKKCYTTKCIACNKPLPYPRKTGYCKKCKEKYYKSPGMKPILGLDKEKDNLLKLYYDGKSTNQIAKIYNCSKGSIKYWLKKFNCSVRDKSLACKLNYSKKVPKSVWKKGQKPWNINPKGAITPLKFLIRSSVLGKRWIKQILKRDNYICQECYQVGGKLEAHHINRFSNIFNDFLATYSQFSPIEDKETLVRLSESYEPFWNIDNGITLCEKCHSTKGTRNACR